MLTVIASCIALVTLTTVMHYEMLRVLSVALPRLRVPTRARLIVVIFATFLAHAAEILLYALAYYALTQFAGFGSVGDGHAFSFGAAVYFSAETYTSLGYGDVIPFGDLRLLAGVEALNGLLLIGWSASYTYIAMERFWNEDGRNTK